MAPSWVIIFAAVALCWAIRAGKALFLTNILMKLAFFRAMFQCAFCTGFHCGYFCYFLSEIPVRLSLHHLPTALLYAFAAALCALIFDILENYGG